MQLYLHKFFISAFIFITTAAAAQVKFTATVSAQQINKDDMLQLRLAVENAQSVEAINPPPLPNFIILSGPSQETGMTNINGTVTRYAAVSYILKPKGPGTFKIAAAAKADGKNLTSNTITVKVANAVTGTNTGTGSLQGFAPFNDVALQQPQVTDYILKKGENAADKINRNMFVKLQTDKTSCYTGQPVLATYKLYTRLKSESNVVKNPSFSGFSVIDMQPPGNMNSTVEAVNGQDYNVYIIRKVQLYPLQAGSLELEPMQVENAVQFIKEEYAAKADDLLNDVFREFADAALPPAALETQKAVLQTKPVVITVKGLPAENTPEAFKGAVGKFTIKGGLEKNSFTTNDAGKLMLAIEGEGNMQLITAPDVRWPDGIEAFEPAGNEELVKTTVPVSGRKLLVWNFTAAQPGNYVIPAVQFSYFNPAVGKYITDSTNAFVFTVTQGTGKKNTAVTPYTKNQTWLNKFFNNRRWVASTVAALIALGLLLWLKKDRQKEAKAAQEAAATTVTIPEPEIVLPVTEQKNYLEKAAVLLNEDSGHFYNELNSALKDYLADTLKVPAATLNKKIITETLDKKNVSAGTVIQLQNLLNNIELQLYTPFAQKEKMLELYNNTAEIIQLLETYKTD